MEISFAARLLEGGKKPRRGNAQIWLHIALDDWVTPVSIFLAECAELTRRLEPGVSIPEVSHLARKVPDPLASRLAVQLEC